MSSKKPKVSKAGKTVVPASGSLERFRTSIDKRWKNTQKLVKLFNDEIIIPNPDAPHEYKPLRGSASYVWDLPEQDRGFLLVEDKVTLYE